VFVEVKAIKDEASSSEEMNGIVSAIIDVSQSTTWQSWLITILDDALNRLQAIITQKGEELTQKLIEATKDIDDATVELKEKKDPNGTSHYIQTLKEKIKNTLTGIITEAEEFVKSGDDDRDADKTPSTFQTNINEVRASIKAATEAILERRNKEVDDATSKISEATKALETKNAEAEKVIEQIKEGDNTVKDFPNEFRQEIINQAKIVDKVQAQYDQHDDNEGAAVSGAESVLPSQVKDASVKFDETRNKSNNLYQQLMRAVEESLDKANTELRDATGTLESTASHDAINDIIEVQQKINRGKNIVKTAKKYVSFGISETDNSSTTNTKASTSQENLNSKLKLKGQNSGTGNHYTYEIFLDNKRLKNGINFTNVKDFSEVKRRVNEILAQQGKPFKILTEYAPVILAGKRAWECDIVTGTTRSVI